MSPDDLLLIRRLVPDLTLLLPTDLLVTLEPARGVFSTSTSVLVYLMAGRNGLVGVIGVTSD
jgi:hypothetical protein